MADPTPTAIPWYKSAVLRGLIVIVITQTLTHFKLVSQFTSTDIGSFVDGLLSVISYLAAAYAAYSRVSKPNPTITSTQAKADAHPPPIPPVPDKPTEG